MQGGEERVFLPSSHFFRHEAVLRPGRPVAIPPRVRAGAWSGWREAISISAPEVERTLSAVAERALRHGARAGLEALVEAAGRLTGTSGAALHAGGRRVIGAGLEPPRPSRAHPLQTLRHGRTVLVLCEPCADEETRRRLSRLAELGSALLACQAREDETRAEQVRLRRERLRLEETLAWRKRRRIRTTHDLRTPLLVLQGYVDMMVRGMGGPLTLTMQRYLERMSRAAGELADRLQHRSADETPAENLRPLLRATFGPGQRVPARLELPRGPVGVRASRAELALGVRMLERLLAGARARDVVVWVDAPEGPETWRLHVRGRLERALPARPRRMLERLAQRLGARLSLQEHPSLELSLSLPR
jgi:two-component system, OmpR family, sensor kinase